MAPISSKTFAVISCMDMAKWGFAEGDSKRCIDLLKRENNSWKAFYACRGNLPTKQDIEEIDGFLIPGSVHSVNDDQEWVRKLEDFIREVASHEKKPKLLGMCFGHQAIAKALGGRVGTNPSKDFVLKSEEIKPADECEVKQNIVSAELFQNGPITLLQVHGECVTELPAGAVTLATSPSCDQEMVHYADNITGIQAHVDFTPEQIEELIMPVISKKYGWDVERQHELKKSFYVQLDTSDACEAILKFLDSN